MKKRRPPRVCMQRMENFPRSELFYNGLARCARLRKLQKETSSSHHLRLSSACCDRYCSIYLIYLPYHVILPLLRGFASPNEAINVSPCGGGRKSLDHHHALPLNIYIYIYTRRFLVHSVVDFSSSSSSSSFAFAFYHGSLYLPHC